MSEDPTINHEPTAADRALDEQLRATRPVPGAGFRGALGRHLAASDPGYENRPPHLWLISGGYLAGGSALLALGALQATGAI
jgi:hypothetical protein